MTCDVNDGNKCIKCTEKYNFDQSSNKCKCAVLNCDNCNKDDGSLCDSCVNNYSPINT